MITRGRFRPVPRDSGRRWAHQRRASAALVVGFSTPGAYRRTLRRVLGSTPTEVDQRGGPDYVARVMLWECEYR